MKRKIIHRGKRRFLAGILCLCLAGTVFNGFGTVAKTTAKAAESDTSDPVTAGVQRQADPSTMDTYKEMINLEDNTRYVGRLWTDKSVFAYGDNSDAVATGRFGREFNGKTLTLSEDLDGVDGEVTADADFLEVYSALGSSIAVNQYPTSPIDLVIVVDMSASMGQDTRYGIDKENAANFTLNDDEAGLYDLKTKETEYENADIATRTMEDRIANSRIQQTLNAVNQTIDRLMEINRNNRVSVVLYGAGASVIMPLAHYEKINGDTPYLSVSGMEPIYDMRDLVYNKQYGWIWVKNRDALYTVTANVKYSLSNDAGYEFNEDDFQFGEEGDISGTYNKTVSNDVKDSKTRESQGYINWEKEYFNNKYKMHNSELMEPEQLQADEYIGYFTNTQGGIFLALSQLAENEYTTYKETLTNGSTNVTSRIPAAIIMSDGGANFAFNEMEHWTDYYGEYDIQKFGNEHFRTDQRRNEDKTDSDHRLGENTEDEWYKVYLPGINDQNAITSLYNESWYNTEDNNDVTYRLLGSIPRWYHAGILYSSDSDQRGTAGTIMQVLMTASYMKSAVDKHYEQGWDKEKISKEDRHDLQTYTVNVDAKHVPQWGRTRLYTTLDPKHYLFDKTKWTDETSFGLKGETSNDVSSIPLTGGTGGIININSVLQSVLENWETWKNGNTATPLAGNSWTDVRINIKPLEESGYKDERFDVTITNDDVEKNIIYNDGFYDIEAADQLDIFELILSLITRPIFDPVTGTNDLGVDNSITFMDPIGKYMEVKDVKNLVLFGWKYDIAKAAVYSYKFNRKYLSEHPGETTEGNFLIEGWYKGDPSNAVYGGAGSVPEQRNYASYASAEEAWADGWVYRLNAKTASTYVPSIKDIDVEGEPGGIENKMRHTEYTFYRVNKDEETRSKLHMNPAYGEESEYLREDDEGVYCLNDLRIWVEDTDGYQDDTAGDSGVESDAAFDEALWINVPDFMLPLRTVTITENRDGTNTYESNLNADGAPAFPVRVFYTVGVKEDLLTEERYINVLDNVDQTYIKNNKVMTEVAADARGLEIGDLEFFSNWYNPENRYDDYTVNQNDYSYGDPVSTFSSGNTNRYYIFQKPLPIYRKAYRYDGSSWNRVTIGSNEGEFSPTEFGGKIVGIDLNCKPDEIDSTLKNQNVTPQNGDIALLRSDQLLSDPDQLSSSDMNEGNYYFMPIDYYELGGQGGAGEADTAEEVKFCVTRNGVELGLSHSSTNGINNMLCWYDASGKNADTYPYLLERIDLNNGRDYIGKTGIFNEDGTLKDAESCGQAGSFVEGGTWIVATNPGGLRVGDLAQAIGGKGGEYTAYEEYKNERFPGNTELNVGYYEQNTTRTANNYYLPTISASSDVGDIMINTYLGNNGRLIVSDCSLLLTKMAEPYDDSTKLPEKSKEHAFNFQVHIDGFTGNQDAVVVKYDEESGQWQSQLHYIDLELTDEGFLQTSDKKMAMTDKHGEPVIAKEDESGSYVYAGSGTEYSSDEGPYYVYIPVNENEKGSSASSRRIYHNNEVDECSTVSENDVLLVSDKNKKTLSLLNTAVLVPKTEYDGAGSGWTYNQDNSNNTILSSLFLLALEPEAGTGGSGSSTDIKIDSKYLIQSRYWTKEISFDGNGNANVELKHGEGLLFTNIPQGKKYEFTEKLDEDEIKDGYRLKYVKHVTSKGTEIKDSDDFSNQNSSDSAPLQYSVSGEVEAIENQAHYGNTVVPGDISIKKVLEASDGTEITETDRETEFTFTLTLTAINSDIPLTPPFTYTITDKEGGIVKSGELRAAGMASSEDNITADPENTWTFSLKGDQTMTVKDLPAETGYQYEIKEYPQGGFKALYLNEEGEYIEGGSASGQVKPNENGSIQIQAEFKNVKKPPEPVPVSVSLNKSVEGDPGWEEGKEFSFLIQPANDNPKGDPVEKKTVTVNIPNDADPLTGSVNVFDKIEYKVPGRYVYTVTELVSSIPGISVDGTVHTIMVDIEEVYNQGIYTGTLKAAVTIDGEPADSPDSGTLSFGNTYDADFIQVPVFARKVFAGGGFTPGQFQFELKGISAVYGDTAQTSGSTEAEEETVNTPATLAEEADAPQDIQPESDEPGGGIQEADSSETVSDNINPVSASLSDGDVSTIENPPMPTPPPVESGKNPVVQENDENGWINFGYVTFRQAGTYTYEMREIPGSDANIQYDGQVYTVTIVISGSGTDASPLRVESVTYEPDIIGGAGVPVFENIKKTGELKITKMVTGENGDTQKEWHFTVTLTPPDGEELNDRYPYIGSAIDGVEPPEDGTLNLEKSGDGTYTGEVTLRHGQSVTITGLPIGTTYTVTEKEANQEGYTTTVADDTGTIPGDQTPEARFVNAAPGSPDENTGNLTVTKTVAGNAGDKTREWHFRVELSDQSVNGTCGDMTFENGVAEFTLKDGESRTATGLPKGVTFTVTETEANQEGYTTTVTGDTGTIGGSDAAIAEFVNEKLDNPPDNPPDYPNDEDGDLEVTKTVTGEDADKDREWHFRVELDDKSVNGAYGDMTFKDGVAEFTLKDGEHKSAVGLPAGTTYTVTEEESGQDGYTTSQTGDSGTIPAGGTAKAQFVNDKDEEDGDFDVSKKVTGKDGDKDREWHFRVELNDHNISGTYGDMVFTDGVAEFTLKDGEHATATGLPEGTEYTVVEKEANQNGYTTTVKGKSGTIPAEGTTRAKFINHKGEPRKGDLEVYKKVTGTAGDKAKEWHFRVKLDDKDINGTYGDMTFKNGVAEFTLKDGEKATATDLPEGTDYTVTEVEANGDGYTTTFRGEAGTIEADVTAVAKFTNYKDTPDIPEEPDEPNPPDKVKTDDSGNVRVWLALLAVAVCGAAAAGVTLARGRRRSGRR